MRRLFLLVIYLSIYVSTAANHFTGATLRYEYTGTPMVYKIQLTLYNSCESFATAFPTFNNVYAKSTLKGKLINKNLPRVSIDSIKQQYCPGVTTSCQNASSSYIGMVSAVYEDTIKLPVTATDWNFVFDNSTRTYYILNLQGASGQGFYIDAPVANSIQPNTSPVLPDHPPFIIFANDTVKVPLTCYDADKDSVAYFLSNPKSGSSLNIPYNSGYGSARAFGLNGLCEIDADNNLVMMSPAIGKYTIALRIDEYRNGKRIASTIRDFVVVCLASSSSKITIPEPDHKNNFETYTCPGRNNALNFNFTDPNPSDAVKITITPPDLPGWTFNKSTSPGTGSASGNVSWTTPLSMNPTKLPQFRFLVTVEDNACKVPGKATYVYKVNTRTCDADSVWPGDANTDKVVDLYDPLAIALAYDDTGATRPAASNSWNAQYCHYWSGFFLNNLDKKHADCNGDGIVDTADLHPIALNYGKTHAKSGRAAHKTTSGPNLYFDHTGITALPDSMVTIKIMLGNATAPVNNLYGLATNIKVDGLNSDTSIMINTGKGWIGNNNNTFSFTKDISKSSVDWAHARTNHQSINGHGQIAEMQLHIPATATPGTLVTLSYDKAKFIDKYGYDLPDIGLMQDTFYIQKPQYISTTVPSEITVQLYPNPSEGNLNIAVNSPQQDRMSITIAGITGKALMSHQLPVQEGNNSITLNTATLPSGTYFVTIRSQQYGYSYAGKWIKL